MNNLHGKVALVTGAASGIGLAVAQHLEAAGATLVVTDINAAGLEEGFSGSTASAKPLLMGHDVGDEVAWSRVVDAIETTHGHLDILVNNAGVMMSKPFAEAGIEVLRRQLRINVEGVYLGMHHALPLLRKACERHATTASIINVSSVYGKVGGAQFAAYSASKGAVRALSKAVAVELASEGIRVNSVLPGPVATNLSADWEPPRDAAGRLVSAEEALSAWARLMPMGRIGMPSDIAPLVCFLASDHASFITGAEFIADGGYTAA